MPQFTVSVPDAAVPVVKQVCIDYGWDIDTPIGPFLQDLFIDHLKVLAKRHKTEEARLEGRINSDNAIGAAVTDVNAVFDN